MRDNQPKDETTVVVRSCSCDAVHPHRHEITESLLVKHADGTYSSLRGLPVSTTVDQVTGRRIRKLLENPPAPNAALMALARDYAVEFDMAGGAE